MGDTATRPVALSRQLGVGALTALVIGEVVGVGIFLTPANMARSLGSPFWLLVVWLVMGAMALSGALCYGELAGRFPDAGGGYVYLRRTYGPAIAFLYGWKCLLVMDPGITAALASGLAGYLGYMTSLSNAGLKLAAVGLIIALAPLSIGGLRLGAWVMQWLTAFKLGALGLMVALALGLQLGSWSHFVPLVAQRPGADPLPGALAPGLVGAFLAFRGWWEIAKLAGETRDPGRTLPSALALGVAAVTAVYLLTSAVFVYLIPLEQVRSGEAFAAQAGEALFGAAGGRVFAGIVIVAVLGSLLGLLLALPRVYYAMARDGVFFKSVAAVHHALGYAGAGDRATGGARVLDGGGGDVQRDPVVFRLHHGAVRGAHGRRAVRAAPPGPERYGLSHSRLSPDACLLPRTRRGLACPPGGSQPRAGGAGRGHRGARTPRVPFGVSTATSSGRDDTAMTWIRTIPLSEADATLRRAIEGQRALYPKEYHTPVQPTADGTSGIVASHTLIPDALYHAFATFGVLMSPELPLTRRQHEMITTMVSVTNRCRY